MNLQKLNPWNWFKHEEGQGSYEDTIPVKKKEYAEQLSNKNNPILELHSEIDKLFDQAFKGFGLSPLFRHDFNNRGLLRFKDSTLFVPSLNVSSDDKEYIITLEAAGMEQKDLSLELSERRLTIKGNKQEEEESKDKDFYRIERKFGSFQRVLALPEDANADGIKANMKNGLLTIKIPRLESQVASSKKIEIENS